jgi:hypothetical protein
MWDWLSWETSRFFGRRILQQVTVREIALSTCAALAAGIVLLLGLTWSATAAIEIFNQWMLRNTGAAPLPLETLVIPTMNNPLSPNGIWITLMLFSTLVPTVCHLVFLIFGALMVITPLHLRLRLVESILSASHPKDFDLAAWYFTLLPAIGVICVSALFLLFFEIMVLAGKPISEMLFYSVMQCISIVRMLGL